jgi:taurine---2-oxoglutarate transaminase
MNSQEMIDLCKKHTLYTWSATGAVKPLPVARAEGVYFFTPEGKRYLDWNSQLMSVNIGHGNKRVIRAIQEQLETLCYVYPQTATQPRAEVSRMLAELMPGDLNTVFFTLSGAESNENAVKMARDFTGRQKILARYRSFHGATNLCMRLTGDPRRWANEPGPPGIIHVMDPTPYDYSFGETDEEKTANNLRYLEEVIMYEGPHTIAAMIIEPVTGTNGILAPPEGYLQGLRALLDRHGILLICDEVMAGFGRTGKWFAHEHGGILPDLMTMAKGLTSSYVPLGGVAVRDAIADYFRENVYWGGLTYNSHCIGLAAAKANLEVLRDDGLVENAARLGAVMREEMDRLQAKHPSVKEGRCLGLFGMIDLQKDGRGTPMAPYNGSSEPMQQLGAFFNEKGLFTFVRWGSFMCNPPLCITEEQLREGYAIVDEGLEITDRYVEA